MPPKRTYLGLLSILFLTLVFNVSLIETSTAAPQEDTETLKKPVPLEANRKGNFQITRETLPAPIYARALASFGSKPTGNPQGMMVAGKTDAVYEVSVGGNYDPEKPAGVFVFISSSDKGKPPKGYANVLAERNLIYIGANKGGNKVDSAWRVSMAAYAVQVLGEAYQLDYDRIYISGTSGGGRAASHAMMGFQDVFSGGLLMVGANAMLPMQNADSSGTVYSDPGVKTFKLANVRMAATMGRYVFYSAKKDFNKKSVKLIAEGYNKHGFKFVTYLEDPSRGHGPATAEYLNKAIDYLDAPVGEIALARMNSAKQLIRRQPGIAARQFRSIVMHADAEKDADDIEKAKKSLTEITESYATDLEKTKTKLEKSNAKSGAKLLEKFSEKWAQLGASDVAEMQTQLDQMEK